MGGPRLDFLGVRRDRADPRPVLPLEFALHSHRPGVILKNGLLRQRSTEFPLRNAESVLIEFPILGRLFNYGTLTVRGFGGSRDAIKRVPKPERVRELIEGQQSTALRPSYRRCSQSDFSVKRH